MKMFSKFIFIALVACSTQSLRTSEQRIIGGSDAKRGQFPHMVSVQLDGGLWCGGTIISESWILSAAHCYETPEIQKNLTAVIGLLRLGENHPDVQHIPVVEVINHPQYIHVVNDTVDNDISLLKLASPIIFSETVQPAKLPEPQEEFTGKAWLSGWGVYQLPLTEPTHLQCLEMPLITKDECVEIFKKVPQPYKLLPSMLCTAPPTKAESGCFGDSGGPLVQNGTLVGATSWGTGICGIEDGPTVFTRVSCYVDFINEHIRNN